MAESITEGTLKQFSKRMHSLASVFFFFFFGRYLTCFIEIGDFVERDEEIATIETDKVKRSRCIFT
jgi:hypothetical protein